MLSAHPQPLGRPNFEVKNRKKKLKKYNFCHIMDRTMKYYEVEKKHTSPSKKTRRRKKKVMTEKIEPNLIAESKVVPEVQKNGEK